MKVTPKEISEAAGIQKTSPPRAQTGASFDKILQSTMGSPIPTSHPEIALPPSPGISLITLEPSGQTTERQLIAQVENLIALLEDYQNKMADPRISLKSIHPLIKQMEIEGEKLRPVLEALPEGSGLKDSLNRALVASSVEVIKFNRGDYL